MAARAGTSVPSGGGQVGRAILHYRLKNVSA
jgi:hypothetical protein